MYKTDIIQDEHLEDDAICQALKKDAIANNKRYIVFFRYNQMKISLLIRCHDLTEDATAQCNCWLNQALTIDKIKNSSCEAAGKKKAMKEHKASIFYF